MGDQNKHCAQANERKLRILEVIPFLGYGGVASFVMDLSKALSKMGNNIKIAVLFNNKNQDIEDSQTKDLQKNEIEVFQFKKNNRNFLGASIPLLKLVKKTNPDVIHLHLRYPVLAALLASPFWGEKVIVETYHSNYKFYKTLTSLSRFFIDHYVAVSKSAAEELISGFKLPKEKVRVIYNGVDIKSIKKETKSIKKTHATNCGQIIILAAGRLSHEKGFIPLVQAFIQLPKHFKRSIKLKLIGDGPLKNQILELISTDPENIEFIPRFLPRYEILKHIVCADIVAMPSSFEGMSIFALEVLALSKPVFVSDIPSYRELFGFTTIPQKKSFGIFNQGLFFNNNTASIRSALEWLSTNRGVIPNFSEIALMKSSLYEIGRTADEYLFTFRNRNKLIQTDQLTIYKF